MKRVERKSYEKPKIERVELRIEEAVLVVCKSDPGTGFTGQECTSGACLTEIGS